MLILSTGIHVDLRLDVTDITGFGLISILSLSVIVNIGIFFYEVVSYLLFNTDQQKFRENKLRAKSFSGRENVKNASIKVNTNRKLKNIQLILTLLLKSLQIYKLQTQSKTM